MGPAARTPRRPAAGARAPARPAFREPDDRERLAQIETVLAGFLRPARARRGGRTPSRPADIVLAAIRVIARDGIRACTVSALARETGFARGHFTYHFRSKEEILGLAFATVGSDFAMSQLGADGPTARDRLEARTRAAVAWVQRRPEYFRCLMNFRVEMMRAARAFSPAGRIRGMLFDVGASVIREGMTAGDLHPRLDPDLESRIVFATIDGLLLHAAMEPARLADDAFADEVWQVVAQRLGVTPTAPG